MSHLPYSKMGDTMLNIFQNLLLNKLLCFSYFYCVMNWNVYYILYVDRFYWSI